ncbi:hypothetical protein STEG23_016789 [Scotinomys teguina]
MEEDAGAGAAAAGLASEKEASLGRAGGPAKLPLPSLPLGDLRFIPVLVKQLKNRGLIHNFHPDSQADVDTKPEPEAQSG